MAAVSVGCRPSPLAGDWHEEGWPKRRRLGSDAPEPAPRGRASRAPATATRPSDRGPTGELALAEALAAALKHNPDLAAFSKEVRRRQAKAIQAAIGPNPRIGLEADEVGRRGNALENVEAAARLKQPILTAGKLEKRTRVAELERDLAGWDYEAKRLDVFTRVVKRYVGVLHAQRRRRVAQKSHRLAQEVKRSVAEQVKAGEKARPALMRAQVELSRARIELDRAKRAVKEARHALARTWGAGQARFERATGDLGALDPLPAIEKLEKRVARNPAIARWEDELAERRARIELAKARRWPNVTPGVGAKYFGGSHDPAALFSLSAELPLFDRNQGNILAARFRLAKAKRQRAAARARVRSRLQQAHQRARSARESIATLRETTLPKARSAYEAVRTAYEEGETEILDVLDAQRSLFETQRQLVEALASYHRHAATIERLVATPIGELGAEKNERNG